MSRKEGEEREGEELGEAELERAAGGNQAARSEPPETGAKNKACFRMLEEDFLFRRLERKGWRR